jgi:two-component system sensor histidine kinase AtoS
MMLLEHILEIIDRHQVPHEYIEIELTETNSDVEFTSYVDPSLPVILADQIKLREVFLNLLRNAKEAIPDAGSIRLDARFTDNIIHIIIQEVFL